MASKKPKVTHQDPEVAIETAIDKTETFLHDNGKALLIGLLVVVLAIGGYMWFRYMHKPAQAEKAGSMMFVAEQYYAQEDYQLALNGDGTNAGFLDVIDSYGNTPQGNVANHYAGICYLKAGDLENALRYLEKYKATDGAPNAVINAQNLGLQGDVLSEQGQYEKAAEMYTKAVSASENSLTTPYFLKKLGMVYQHLGRHNEAADAFRRVTEEFPSSMEARDIDKYLGAAEQN